MSCTQGSCGMMEGFTWTTMLIILIISIVFMSVVCCVCIKIRDMKLQSYVRKLAKSKGVKLEMAEMDLKAQKHSPNSLLSENCTIMIPDVAIVL